jgi:molybdopterin-guanine dinucleotide biosynthesis protein A
MMIHPFAAVLLAGGRSQRMGQDKAFLKWEGDCLWQLQLDKLSALNPSRLILSCREEQRAQFGPTDSRIEWFFDPPNFQLGPLGIIDRVLRVVQMPLIVLAVDMPRMTVDFMRQEFLAAQILDRGLLYSSASGLEPLAALYVPSMLPIMAKALKADQLSLQKLLLQAHDRGLVDIRMAVDHQKQFFSNCNTPSEWEHEKGRSERPA